MGEWTGGTANRQYRSGAAVEPAVDIDEISRQVQEYLFDCARLRRAPTEKECLKIVHHQGDAQKQAVIAAYRQQMGGAHG